MPYGFNYALLQDRKALKSPRRYLVAAFLLLPQDAITKVRNVRLGQRPQRRGL